MLARLLTAPLFLVLAVGCQGPSPCPGTCTQEAPETFLLSCPGNLTGVTASGPCALDASPRPFGSSLTIGSPSPGVCHVVLTFASGFVYSTDVTFVSQTDPEPPGCGTCPAYPAATQRTIMVDDPGPCGADAAPGD